MWRKRCACVCVCSTSHEYFWNINECTIKTRVVFVFSSFLFQKNFKHILVSVWKIRLRFTLKSKTNLSQFFKCETKWNEMSVKKFTFLSVETKIVYKYILWLYKAMRYWLDSMALSLSFATLHKTFQRKFNSNKTNNPTQISNLHAESNEYEDKSAILIRNFLSEIIPYTKHTRTGDGSLDNISNLSSTFAFNIFNNIACHCED